MYVTQTGWAVLIGIGVGILTSVVLLLCGVSQDTAVGYGLASGAVVAFVLTIVFEWRERRQRPKRYAVSLDEDLTSQLEAIAENSGVTVLELAQRFIKLGFLFEQVDEDEESALFLASDDERIEVPSDIDEAIAFFEERIKAA